MRAVACLCAVICLGGCLERSGPCEGSAGDNVSGDPDRVELHATIQTTRFVQPAVDWWHTVLAGDQRLLLVIVNTDAPSTHPISVTVDGTPMELQATQGAPAYGALSLWTMLEPPPGGVHVEVTYAVASIWGFAHSVSFAGVSPSDPIANIAGATHGGGGPYSQLVVRDTPGDLTMVTVSWGNNQSTEWFGTELELWDESDPGSGSSLGSAAAILEGSEPLVTFGWDSSSDSSGAHLGFSLRAAR